MTGYFTADDCHIDEFEALISEPVDPAHLKFASLVEHIVPVYGAERVAQALAAPASRRELMAEWARVFGELSGVVVQKGALPDLDTDPPIGGLASGSQAELLARAGGRHERG